MRLYVKLFYTGTMPGPFVFMRDRLIPCEPRPIALDAKEGVISSSIHARINERAGLTRDRRAIGTYGICESNRPGRRCFFWRAYGHDNPLPWKDSRS